MARGVWGKEKEGRREAGVGGWGHGYDHLLDNPVIFFPSIEGVPDESRNLTHVTGLFF